MNQDALRAEFSEAWQVYRSDVCEGGTGRQLCAPFLWHIVAMSLAGLSLGAVALQQGRLPFHPAAAIVS